MASRKGNSEGDDSAWKVNSINVPPAGIKPKLSGLHFRREAQRKERLAFCTRELVQHRKSASAQWQVGNEK
jgi:hypothetical protein